MLYEVITILGLLLVWAVIGNTYSQEVIDLFIWAGQSNAQGRNNFV